VTEIATDIMTEHNKFRLSTLKKSPARKARAPMHEVE